jgi:hypothetical protein
MPAFHSPDTLRFSKKSKIQSHNLAPAILEGLMPITTEEEPEDVDDDAPSRVRIFPLLSSHFMLTLFSSASRLSELSMGLPQICLQPKFSQLSGHLLCNISLLPTPTTDVVLFSPLVFALRDAVNI